MVTNMLSKFVAGFTGYVLEIFQLFDMASSKQQSHSSQSDTAVHFKLNVMMLPAADTTWAYSCT